MMIKEWLKKSEFNSFNSWKGLFYADWYKAIVRGEFKPPIEASLDPIHACNLMCSHCNAHRYLNNLHSNPLRMPDEHLIKLIGFLAEWGVMAICFGGGGEPTLHTLLPDALRITKLLNMESAIATNGTLFNDELINVMVECCRWVGISVDAGTRETYRIVRKADLFEQVLTNIEKLTKKIKTCDVAYKFLILPHNYQEIYTACKIAKELGVKDFHARPADLSHQGMGELRGKLGAYDIEAIQNQFERCRGLEDDNFRVFTVVHKYKEDFKPQRNFSQCYAAPLCIQLCADGNVYFCVDQRHQEEFKLGVHYPDPENILNFWGGEKHKALVFGGIPEKCKTRCTFGVYCRQCEQLFVDNRDPMCWRFV